MDRHGYTPLHLASTVPLYRLCVELGANPHCISCDGSPTYAAITQLSALDIATITNSEKFEVCLLILQQGLLIENILQEILVAIRYYDVPDESLSGFYVDTVDSSGMTALHWAAYYENVDAVEYLVTNKHALVNAQCGGGNTPLYYAVQSGRERIVKFLLNNGALNRPPPPTPSFQEIASQPGYDRVITWLEERSHKMTEVYSLLFLKTSPTNHLSRAFINKHYGGYNKGLMI